MNSRTEISATVRILALAMLHVCLIAAGTASAGIIESSGLAGDGKWSSPGNWVGGVPPQNGDAVVILDDGVVPTNVDIVDLDLLYIQFSNTAASINLIGNDLKVNNLRNRLKANFIENNIILKSSAAWNLYAPLTINGVLGATNDAISLAANNSSVLTLRNTNTWAGGLKANQCTVVIYFDANLGTVPPTNVPRFIDFGANLSFQSTGGFNRFVLHPNRGIRFANVASKFITIGANTKLIINQQITEDSAGRGMQFNNSLGVLELGGSNTFSGQVGATSANWLIRMKHPWALGQGATESTMLYTQGTYDVMGNNLPTRRIRGNNGTGWPGLGCIMNSVAGTTCVISNGFYNANSAGAWFGRGDFVMYGTLDFNTTGTTAPLKYGPGRLVLKNKVCITNRIHMVNGTLVWDYSDAIQDKLPDGQTLRLDSGVLETVGNAAAPVVEQIGRLDISSTGSGGANALNIASGMDQDFTLSLSNIVLGRVCEVDFNPIPNGAATVKIATTHPGGELTNGTLRYNVATYKQSTWAMIADGIVTGMPDASYVTDFSTSGLNDHLDVAGAVNVGGCTAMTMRFKSPAATTLTVDAGKTLRTAFGDANNGAILVAPGAGKVDINGGTIDFGVNSMFHVHQYNTNAPLVIASRLGSSSNPGVSKCGPGELILTNRLNAGGGQNNGFQIHEGIVTVDSITNNDVFSAIGYGSATYPLVLGNGTLRYIGKGHASDRAISLRGDGTIEANGSDSLYFTRQSAFMTQSGGADSFITLAGTGTGIVDGVFVLRTGAIIKDGPGVWILNGTNNQYYSDTVVKQGSLVLNGNILYSDCVVKGGAVSGTGDWSTAALYVQNGGTVAPGSSVGTLTFGEINLEPGSVYEWEVDGNNTAADKLISLERLSLPEEAPNSVTVKVVQVGGPVAGAYPAMTFAMLTGNTNALVVNAAGTGYSQASLNITDTGISVGLVPEPVLVVLAPLALLALRRRA